MKANFKVSVWESIKIPEELEEEVKNAFEQRAIITEEDLLDFLYERGYEDVEVQTNFETKQGIYPDPEQTAELVEDGKIFPISTNFI